MVCLLPWHKRAAYQPLSSQRKYATVTRERHVRSRRFRFNPALWLILLPFFVGMIFTLPAAGVPGTLSYFKEAIGSVALSLVLVAPLVLFALWRSPSEHRGLLVLTATLLILSWASVLLPRAPFLQTLNLTGNWQGKLLDLSWALLFVLFWRKHKSEQLGLRWRTQPDSFRPILIVMAVFTLLFAIPGFFRQSFTTEEIFYQLTMPSLSEELIFRGILLALLNQVFGRPWRLAGAPVGWGLVITSALFGLTHGAAVTATGLLIAPVPIIATGLIGAILGWMRERSGSLWPPILAHSLINTAEFVIPLSKLLF